MPKIKKNKNKIEQCTKLFIYRDLNQPWNKTFGSTVKFNVGSLAA